nr:MAG TPA: virion morphogenesis protein [Caudoviricetes sp.]
MRIIVRHDLSRLSARLGRLAGTLSDGLAEPLRAIGGIVESSARHRIAEEKAAPDGVKWADVSAQTKQRKNGRGGILVDHGHLLASITHEASADSVIIGSVMNYAAYLQEGTEHMPARPFLGLSDKDYRDIDHLLEDWLRGLIAP